MGIHFTHRSGGPCWSRERGYHQPDPLPRHIMEIITTPAKRPTPKTEFCWLVELFEGDGTGNSAGWYHTGFVDIGGHSRTTKSPYEARRYATREQAEQIAAKLGTTLTGTWKAVEHGFDA